MRLTTVADLLYALDSKLTVSAVPLDVDSILGSTTWVQGLDFSVKQPEYQEINKETQKELTQAA
jgi:hypothetical protein